MRLRMISAVMALALLATMASSCSSSSAQSTSPSFQQSTHRPSGIPKLSTLDNNTYVNGPLNSKKGPYVTDRFGRIITMHGVNAVYKLAPYTLTVTPGQPNTLGNGDAQRIAGLGFNMVRLGILWAGIEPGTGGPNQPKVCTKGAVNNPGMWNQKTANAYLNQVQQVVNELGRHHIYVLLDMHQDVWSSVFGGEGAPAWATCTDGLAIPVTQGRWSNAYGEGAEINAWNNFWNNAVTGGLQQEYNRSWAAVAKKFSKNSWVMGYDPINEPSAMDGVLYTAHYEYSVSLSCLYGGRSADLVAFDDKTRIICPTAVPTTGVIGTILKNDPHHLVYPEVDNATNPKDGKTLYLAKTPTLSKVVYNFHDYCPYRSGVTGNPQNSAYCSEVETTPMVDNYHRRELYATTAQPLGPAIFMSEFGATSSYDLASLITLDAESLGISWAWWSWRYYNDPTGSSAEALVGATNELAATAPALTSSYAMAVAGVPLDAETNPINGQYTLLWEANPAIKAPTTIYLDPLQFQYNYCVITTNGTITSQRNAQMVTIKNPSSTQLVGVRILPGLCP